MNNFGQNLFITPMTLVDASLAATVRGPGCPRAPPNDHSYMGLGASLGDSGGRKPQQMAEDYVLGYFGF